MQRHREFDAFIDALDGVPPDAVTACAGWTAHELVAHLTSGVEAIASQIAAHLDGDAIPQFGSFAEREIGFWDVDDAALRDRLVDGERGMTSGLDALRAVVGGGEVGEIGWGMPLDDLDLHFRQEYAIHRWDLIGDDEEGNELLALPELIDHSVRVLAPSLLAAGRRRDPGPNEPLSVRIRVDGQPDLLVDVGASGSQLYLVDPGDADADVECDAAARLLLLWGRRPAVARRVRTSLGSPALARLTTVLSGY